MCEVWRYGVDSPSEVHVVGEPEHIIPKLQFHNGLILIIATMIIGVSSHGWLVKGGTVCPSTERSSHSGVS